MSWLVRKLISFAHWLNDALYEDGKQSYRELQKNRSELARLEKKGGSDES